MSDAMRYEMFTFMEAFKPINANDEIYLMFGKMLDMDETLLVTHKKTSKHMFCCNKHRFIYPINAGKCEMCQAEPQTQVVNP